MRVALIHRLGIAALAFAALAYSGTAASAQELDAKAAGADTSCTASTRVSDGVLRIVCGETGFLLGNPTSHTLVAAPLLKAAIIDTSYGEDRRVWLIVTGDDGQPVLEEITGTLARAAGRGATFDLSGLTIDLALVSSGGAIAIGPGAGAGIEGGTQGSVDVAALVSRATTAGSAVAAAAQ